MHSSRVKQFMLKLTGHNHLLYAGQVMVAMGVSQIIEAVEQMEEQEEIVSMDLEEGMLAQEEKGKAQEDKEGMSFIKWCVWEEIMPRKSMLKKQLMTENQEHVGLSLWKRLILIAGILLPGGSLVVFIPSQAVYAQFGGSQSPFVCQANHGGNGGIANNRSSGGNGNTGGDCVNGPKGGDAGPGGEAGSPGGPGGNVFF